MRVFVTGATGFIGSAVVLELIKAGHQVLGLARSEEGAKSLLAAGAEVQRGSLEDVDSLRSGAEQSEGVIHTAFNHDFSRFVQNCEEDRRAIEVMGAVLEGSDRQLIVTAGVGVANPGHLRSEQDAPNPIAPNWPRKSEQAAAAVAERGVRVSVVRLPQVHDRLRQGLITYAIALARDKKVSAYLGEGTTRWAACPRFDAARLYRLVLEKNSPANYNAVAEEGIPLRTIAEAIGRGLKVPVVSKSQDEAAEHFGWMAAFMGLDLAASSSITQQMLDWHPTGAGLISDLDQVRYFDE
jgi:nucleoside-diphosphate-sugar epimerase